MNEISDLELNIMSCLLLKPELMNQLIVEDKHFIKHQRLWQFMKSFYKKFGTFDIQLMYSICKDKWHIVNYLQWLAEIDVYVCNFEKYQKQLIEQQEEDEQDKIKIDLIYKLANDLWVRNITLEEFKNKIIEIIGGKEK